MTMNQATAAAFFLAALASSSAASSSSHEELKDEIAIAPLLAYRPYHYLYRNRMRMSDECLEDIFNVVEAHPTLFVNASDACASKTVVGDTTIFDYDGCDLSNITEACTADNGTIVAENWGNIGVDCTYLDKIGNSTTYTHESFQLISKESFECIPASCVSEWESGEGHMSDEPEKALERYIHEVYGAYKAECKINSLSAESLAALGSSAGKATGMLALAATAAVAAVVLF